MFDPSSSDYDSKSFLVPEGKYLAMITEAVAKKTAKGDDMVVLEFDIIEPGSDHVRSKIKFQNYVLSQKAAWRFAQVCRAIGQTTPFDARSDEALWNVLGYQPIAIDVTVEDNEYKGKVTQQNRVDAVFPLSEPDRDRLRNVYGEDLVPVSYADDGGGAGSHPDDEPPF
jgi:hypothetical protein